MNTPDFSDLEKFIKEWGDVDAHSRLRKRSSAEFSDIKAFYDVIVPHLEEIIEFLNQFPIDDIPEQYQPLAFMALSACEIDDPVNIWKASELTQNSNSANWRVKRSLYDYMNEKL